MKADDISRTSSAAIGRNSLTRTADHALTGKTSVANVSHRRKKRKLSFGRGCRSQNSREGSYHTSFEPRRNPTFLQHHTLAECAVEVSAIPSDLVSKLSLPGSTEVLWDLRHTLVRLRSHSSQALLVSSDEIGTPFTRGSHDTLRSLQTAQILSMLWKELEFTEIEEQLYRFRKRLALS